MLLPAASGVTSTLAADSAALSSLAAPKVIALPTEASEADIAQAEAIRLITYRPLNVLGKRAR